MRANDELHSLIHSLSPSEKRYFKLHVQPFSRDASTFYLELFDLIRQQEEYDQAAILRKLGKQRDVTRFSAEKQYLYQLILKVMRSYAAENDVMRRIKGMVQDLEFLYDKALYAESMKLLNKARNLATEYDDLAAQVELLTWERKLLKRLVVKEKGKRLEDLITRKDRLMAQLQQQTLLADLYDQLFLVIQRDTTLRSAMEIELLDRQLEAAGLAGPVEPTSFHSRHLYFQIMSFYHQLRGERQVAWTYYQRLVNLWEEHPMRISEAPGKYQTLLFNYLGYLRLSEQYGVFPEVIAKLRGMVPRNNRESIQAQSGIYYYELLYRLNIGDFASGLKVITEMQEWLVENEDSVPVSRLLGFYHNSAQLMFLAGQFKESLKWVNRILNYPESETRRDSIQFARMLLMVLHFELGNYDLVEDLLRSAQYYFRKHERLYGLEETFLRMVKRLVREVPARWPEAFLALKVELQSPSEMAKAWPGWMELEIWVESHLSGQPIAAVARTRFADSGR